MERDPLNPGLYSWLLQILPSLPPYCFRLCFALGSSSLCRLTFQVWPILLDHVEIRRVGAPNQPCNLCSAKDCCLRNMSMRGRAVFLDKSITATCLGIWNELWQQDLLLVAVPINPRPLPSSELAVFCILLPLRGSPW